MSCMALKLGRTKHIQMEICEASRHEMTSYIINNTSYIVKPPDFEGPIVLKNYHLSIKPRYARYIHPARSSALAGHKARHHTRAVIISVHPPMFQPFLSDIIFHEAPINPAGATSSPDFVPKPQSAREG